MAPRPLVDAEQQVAQFEGHLDRVIPIHDPPRRFVAQRAERGEFAIVVPARPTGEDIVGVRFERQVRRRDGVAPIPLPQLPHHLRQLGH